MQEHTPLLPMPVNGAVWLINKAPLPWLGVDLSYPGVNVRMVGTTSTPQAGST